MRMWMVDPRIMCRQHLMGEHIEIHMLIGSMKRAKNLDAYIRDHLIQPRSIVKRHDEIVEEMLNRGWNHHTPVPEHEVPILVARYGPVARTLTIDRGRSLEELLSRCSECTKRKASMVAFDDHCAKRKNQLRIR